MKTNIQVGNFFLEARLLLQQRIVIGSQAEVLFGLFLVLLEEHVSIVAAPDLFLGGAVLYHLHFADCFPQPGLPTSRSTLSSKLRARMASWYSRLTSL